MCNISGYSGTQPPDPLKLKLLHIQGRQRGTDSSGIVINNKVTKTVSSYKRSGYYSDSLEEGDAIHLVQSEGVKYSYKEWDTFNVLQHNRRKSVGGKTEKEAHPYELLFKGKDGSAEALYFIHNGTITNIERLCSFYNKNFKDYHTDSHALAELILEFGFDVLQYYTGGAALAFYYTDEPNKLYLFKGSKKLHYKKDNKEVYEEERPLHYVYLDNGLYFSSLMAQLETIIPEDLEESPTIYTALDNKVMIFKDGKLDETISINRLGFPKDTEETLAAAKGILSPEEVYISDKVQYFAGKYYLNGKPIHGEFNVGINGFIEGVLPKKYYFIEGKWVRTEEDYKSALDKIKNGQTDLFFFSSEVHGDSVHIGNNDTYYFNCSYCSNRFIKPRFSEYYIKTDGTADIKNVFTPKECWEEGLLSESQAKVEMFNYHYGTLLASTHECEAYFTEVMQTALDWKTITKFPEGVTINKKYKEKKNNKEKSVTTFRNSKRTVWTPKDGTTVITHPAVADNNARLVNFNNYHGTTFDSREEANTWHLATYGTEHDRSWGLDEELLEKESYGNQIILTDIPGDDDKDEYNDLFWSKDKKKEAQYDGYSFPTEEEIESQLIEEYGVILDKVIDFGRDYGPLGLTDSLGQKVKAVNSCAIILTNNLNT